MPGPVRHRWARKARHFWAKMCSAASGIGFSVQKLRGGLGVWVWVGVGVGAGGVGGWAGGGGWGHVVYIV